MSLARAQLAAGLAALADDPERRRLMAHASREIGRRLTGETMAQAYLTIYREAIERVARRSGLRDAG